MLAACLVIGPGTAAARARRDTGRCDGVHSSGRQRPCRDRRSGCGETDRRSGPHRNRDWQRLRDFAARLRADQRARHQQQRVHRQRRTPEGEVHAEGRQDRRLLSAGGSRRARTVRDASKPPCTHRIPRSISRCCSSARLTSRMWRSVIPTSSGAGRAWRRSAIRLAESSKSVASPRPTSCRKSAPQRGTISALRAGDTGERRVLQINGTVNPGNSGGPLVDRDGYAVGVIRARVTGDAGIGFAIPINQAKDFLESRGLDSLMPSRRFRLGALQSLEGKGIALRLPEGVGDTSPFRSRVESDPGLTAVALRIDRVVSPWTPGNSSERWLGPTRSSACRSRRAKPVRSRARRRPAAVRSRQRDSCRQRAEVRMQYGILDLGAEKLVARYVGSAEQLAYNESVFRDSLLSLEGQRLISGDAACRSSVSNGRRCRPAVNRTCRCRPAGSSNRVRRRRAPAFRRRVAVTAAYPARDVTLALRAAVWDAANVVPEEAASACSSRRGSSGAASYALRAEWLGVSYCDRRRLRSARSRQVVQLEVIAPDQKGAWSRALLAAWMKRRTEP